MQSRLKIVVMWIWKKTDFAKFPFFLNEFYCLQANSVNSKRDYLILIIHLSGVLTPELIWALLSNTANEDIADRTVNFVNCT